MPFPSPRHVGRGWAQFATAIRRRKGIHTLVWKKHLEILLRCCGIPPPLRCLILAAGFGTLATQFGVFSPRVRVARNSLQPSVDCTPFYRQHLCRGQCIQGRSRPQQHTWNSKPFVIFPAELLLHKDYIFNILCGLRLWIQDIYSKEKPSLAMFISTSNEQILEKTMVKIRGLTICLIRVSVQWLTCWHCSLF